MKNLVIRKLLQKDYKAVREVDIQTQRQYLGNKFDLMNKKGREKHLVSRKNEFAINLESGYCFVASLNDKIIGFILAHETQPFLGNIYIRYIGINPQYQGHGIGMFLYKELIKKARKNKIEKITALINLDNPYSMKLHKKAGFNLKDRKEAVLQLMSPQNVRME